MPLPPQNARTKITQSDRQCEPRRRSCIRRRRNAALTPTARIPVPERSEGLVQRPPTALNPARGRCSTPDVDPTASAKPAAPGAPAPDIDPDRRRGRPIIIAARRAITISRPARVALHAVLRARLPHADRLRGAAQLPVQPRRSARSRACAHPPAARRGGRACSRCSARSAAAAYALAGPAQRWAATAPQTLRRAPRRSCTSSSARCSRSRSTGRAGGRRGRRRRAGGTARRSSCDGPSVVVAHLRHDESSSPAILEIVILLYFLLAGGDLFLQKLIKVLPALQRQAEGGGDRARDRGRRLGVS